MKLDETKTDAAAVWLYGRTFAKFELPLKSVEAMRYSARLARTRGETDREGAALYFLLNLSDAGENLADADALRGRIAELKVAPPAAE